MTLLVVLLVALVGACGGAGGDDDADPQAFEPRSPGGDPTDDPAEGDDPAVLAGATDGLELGEPYVGDLAFVLPVDCAVPVQERRTESTGVEVELAYELRFTAAAGGAEVATAEVELVRLRDDGEDRPVSRVDPVVFERPRLLVDEAGEVVEVRGTDDLVARLPIAPAARPFVRQGLELDMTERLWGIAFGTWAAWGTIGAPEERTVVDRGTDEERTVRVTSVGTDGDEAVLRFETTFGPAAFRQAAGEAVPDLASAFDDVDGSMHDRSEVVVDPATLRPSSVFWERVIEIDDGVEVQRRSERRTLRLDWGSSTCD